MQLVIQEARVKSVNKGKGKTYVRFSDMDEGKEYNVGVDEVSLSASREIQSIVFDGFDIVTTAKGYFLQAYSAVAAVVAKPK